MSVFIHGFHAGDAYSSPSRIIVVYKVMIFSGVVCKTALDHAYFLIGLFVIFSISVFGFSK